MRITKFSHMQMIFCNTVTSSTFCIYGYIIYIALWLLENEVYGNVHVTFATHIMFVYSPLCGSGKSS